MAKLITNGVLRNSFDRRSVVVGSLQSGVGLLLATRLGYIALADNEKYKTMSESNRVNLSLIPPRRGWILDRMGQPIASNRADFRVDLIPEKLIEQDKTLAELAGILHLDEIALQEIRDHLEKSRGFQPVEAGSHLSWEQFAAVSVRQPDMPGVVPQRSFSRYYPSGPCVGHLVGYVGVANAKDYEQEHNPLLITPGFKIGKDGLEKQFDAELRGVPGARRSEVTAGGRVVRDLETREDVPGKAIKLTVHAGLQEYAARRIGTESAAVVVMDCETGDLLSFVSMPSFDPNSFTDGVGRIEWKMLSDDDHVPLRNKILHGLYPPGSTVKPTVALAFLEAGLSPDAAVNCSGGLRVGNRVFHCWNHHGHGRVDMAKGIYQSCDVYFYHFAQQIGMDQIARTMRKIGYGQKFPLPYPSQSFGTVPDPAWKLKKYNKEWAIYDTVNATIGQGYVQVNPLQQAVIASRLASGKLLMPRLLHDDPRPAAGSLGVPQEHLDFIHAAMKEMVNGLGTGHAARLPIDGVQLAGKSGTAQVVGLNIGNGKGGLWRHRDHGHFICFAPFDKPKYACAVLVEHGGGSPAAMPIARDVMTYMFDQQKAWDALLELEKGWGGTPQERQAAKYRSYAAQYGVRAPQVEDSEEALAQQEQEAAKPAPQPIQSDAAPPAPEPEEASAAPAPAATPKPAAEPQT
ncbi:penicillin-binding protein 2 [Novosphingobium umbonatum]|uniref:Penicillin-binding protein 2 n=1 Tax=Novosphingobium umbonatum TaxID=1908524 RepID=A0A3S2VUL4_9SPHN|nr:penicillin-binding protein 2 [Novosphingobium umbonatum]RVU06202.1 penicillin-binding protein 2 [Novosphingobium umbonatum]